MNWTALHSFLKFIRWEIKKSKYEKKTKNAPNSFAAIAPAS